MSKETLPPGDNPFAFADPLLVEIRQRLSVATPDQTTRIKALFAIDLKSVQPDLVGLRSYDVVTLLGNLLDGEIDLSGQAQQMVWTSPGWFYMTPIYTHPYFDRHPELKEAGRSESFLEIATENAGMYGEFIAFATAFMTNVVPFLPENWLDVAREVHENMFPEEEGISDSEALEYYLHQLHTNVKTVVKEHTEELALQGIYENKYYALSKLISLIDPSLQRHLLEFLETVVTERNGVIVGFDEAVLQGKVVSNATDYEIIHAMNEIAVSPEDGKINTQDMRAAESLGDYEDRILQELGIID